MPKFFRKWLKRLIMIVLALLLLIVILIAAGIAFIEIRRNQTVVLPEPTGPYAVGRMEYDWTDQARTDPLAPRADTKRELVVWAWYPASRVPKAHPAPYLPPKWAQVNSQQHSLFGISTAQSSDSIQTNSMDQAPPWLGKHAIPS